MAAKQKVPTKRIKKEIRSLRKNLSAEKQRASRVAKAVRGKTTRIEKKASKAERKAVVVGRKAAKAEKKASAVGRDMILLRAEMEKLSKKKTPKKQLSEYNLFMRRQLRAGKSFRAAVKLWKAYKRGAARPRTVKRVTVVRRVASKPKVVFRTKVRTIVKRVPVTRTVVRTVRGHGQKPSVGLEEIESKIYSVLHSELSKQVSVQRQSNTIAEEKLALDLVAIYFQEVHRLGLKRRLGLDDVVRAYFEVLSKVKSRHSLHTLVPEHIEKDGQSFSSQSQQVNVSNEKPVA